MAAVSTKTFVKDFNNGLSEHNVAIFAGAGLSVPLGFVDWRGLLKPLAEELELDIDRETDLVRIAQYHVNHHQNRADLTDAILNGFSRRDTAVTENHRILARLPIETYWTTNYDQTIEEALRLGGKLPDVKHSIGDLPRTLHGRDAVVYKMHGDKDDPTNAVLCKEDYETYHLKRGDFLTALAGDLISKMFIFIGFSFSDPNLDYVLSRLYTRHGRNQRKHFCFVKRELSKTLGDDQDLSYRKAKQELFIRDLERYNIRAVMVDRYEDVTDILRQVEDRHKSRTVFISGAAHDYGAYSAADALDFVHNLSQELIARDFRLVTGLGVGIGSVVVDGALQQIYQVQRRSLKDQLVIRPFPQSVAGQKLWKTYREDMLDFAGLGVFMFGNKLEEESARVVDSSGVIEEFEISHAKGIRVLPLGFTGFVARQLYDKVQGAFATYYPKATPAFTKHFAMLGDATRTMDEQLQATVEGLIELQRMG